MFCSSGALHITQRVYYGLRDKSMRGSSDERLYAAWHQQLAALMSFVAVAGRTVDLSLTEVALLEQIQSLGGSATPKQLCQVLSIPSASMTTVLDRLESKKFIARKSNPKDRRSTLIVLGPSAVRFGEEVLLPLAKQIQFISKQMNEATASKLAQALESFATAIQEAKNRIADG
jgi:MarR family transcriptional regulator, 2-MHQ and catechol-resistance regulon repressor